MINATKSLYLLLLLLLLSVKGFGQLTLGFNSNGNTAGCAPYTLTFPITNVSSNPATTNYTINFGDGSPILNYTQATLPASVTHTYTLNSCGSSFQATNNVYGATITATSPSSSPFTAAVSPIVISSPPDASISPLNSVVCVGSSVVFNDISSQGVYIDPSAGYACLSTSAIHYWTVSPAVGWSASAASLGSNNGFPAAPDFEVWSAGATNLSVQFTQAGSYRIKIWIANTCGLDTMSVPVCVVPAPNPQFTLNPNVGCIPPNLNVNANNTTVVGSVPCNTPTYTYTWAVSPTTGWNYAGASTSTSVSPNFTFTQNGNYTVTLNASAVGLTGCSASINRPVTVNLAPVVNAGLDQSVCVGAAAIQLTGSPAGGTWSGTGVTSGGSFNPSTVGNFTLTYTYNSPPASTCPPQTDQVVISVITPTAANAGPDQSVCPGTPAIQLAATPTGGTWSGTGVTSGGSFTPGAPGNYTLTYTFGSGPCAVSDQKVITVYSPPVVNVNDAIVCEGLTTALSAAGSAGLSPYTYSWSPAAGLSATTGGSVTASPTTSSNYTVTVTDAHGCQATDIAHVTVNPLPTVNAGSDLSICNVPTATQMTGNPIGGTWSGIGVTSAGAFTPTGLGPVVLTYTYTNSNGCIGTDQVIVTVVNPSQASAGLNQNFCLGSPALQLNGTPAGGTWSGTGVNATGLFNPSVAGPSVLTYSFGSGTCLTTDQITITSFTSPTVNVNSGVICQGGSLALTAAGAGGLAPYTYSWSPATGLSGITGATVTASPANTANYTVTVTDNHTCTATAVSTVTVNSTPVVNAGPDQAICLNPNSIQLNGTPAGGTWSGDNVSPTGLYTPVAAGIDTLIYSISLVGCGGVDTMNITVSVPAPLQLTPDTTVCLNSGNFQLFAATPGGTWTSATATLSASGIFTPDSLGTFVVSYSVGAGFCAVGGSLTVNVIAPPTVNAGPDFSTCLNANPAAIVGESPTSGGTWSWSGTGIVNPVLGIFDPSVAGIGPHTLTYTYTSNATGCTASDQLVASVDLLPSINLNPAVLNVCLTTFGSPVTATPVGGTWTGAGLSFGNNFDAQLDSAIYTPTATGTFWIYYTYADANGCQNSDSTSITVINPQPVNAGLDEAFCYSTQNYQLTGTPAGGSWISPSWLSAAGVFSGSQVGTHQGIYAIGTGSCLVYDTVQFIVHPLPVVQIGADVEHCADDPCFFFPAPSPLGGVWSGSGISDPITGEFCPSIAGIGSSQIIYTYQHPTTTCINRDTLISTVLPMPVPGMSLPFEFCINTPTQVINQSVGPPMTFTWNVRNLANNALVLSTTDVSPIISIPSVGNFSIELICISTAGCERRDTFLFNTLAPPVAAFQLADDVMCGPIVETVTNTSTGLQMTYLWDFGPSGPGSTDTIPTLPVFLAPILNDTIYHVTLQVTNLCGTSTAIDSIRVRPIPVADVGTDYSQGCSPFAPVYQNVSYGSPDWFSWDFGDGATSTDSLPSGHIYTTVDSIQVFTITLSIGNPCGTSSATTEVIVYPTNLNPQAPTLVSGCAPYEAFFSFPLGDLSYYLWDFGDSTGLVGNSVSHIYETPGSYQVQLNVSNFCLVDSFFYQVNVAAGPDLDFNLSQNSVCQSREVTAINNSANANGFSIDFGDGFQPFSGTATHVYDQIGTQSISLAGQNPLTGCRDTLIRELDVIPYPEILVTADPDTGCSELRVQFYNSTIGATSYEWHFADGTGSVLAEPLIDIATPGDFIAELIAHNYQGSGQDCPDTATVVVHVYPSPTSSFELLADTACGPPVEVGVTNTSQGGIAYTWLWEASTSNEVEPIMEFSQVGFNEIKLIAENAFACKDTSTADFFVLGQPNILLDFDVSEGCQPLEVKFNNYTVYGDSVSWSFGDGQSSILNNPSHVYDTPGLYSVELFVSSGDRCFDDSLMVGIIQVNPSAIAGLQISPSVVSESVPLVNLVNTSQLATTYELYLGEDLLGIQVPPTFLFDNPDTGFVQLSLIANNVYNCPDTTDAYVDVIASPAIYFPNSFSPNEDGKNEGFKPVMDRAPTYYYFSIYDRWGHRVFETFDYQESWDGTYYNLGRKQMKQDVYVYKLSAIFQKDQIYNLFGNVTLVY